MKNILNITTLLLRAKHNQGFKCGGGVFLCSGWRERKTLDFYFVIDRVTYYFLGMRIRKISGEFCNDDFSRNWRKLIESVTWHFKMKKKYKMWRI